MPVIRVHGSRRSRKMNCLKCGKALGRDGKCACGFALFSTKVLFTGPLPGRFLKEVQTHFASQGTVPLSELKRLTGDQLYKMATKIIESQEEPRDYHQAAMYYRLAAEKNHALSQFCLGNCYEDGIGVPKDHAAAMEWYERAARQQIHEAQYRLGWLYRNGWDIKRDDKKSVEWLEKAAYGGIVEAQYLLGWMFRNASGVEKDVQRAAKWMRLASEQGHPDAMRAYQYMKNYDGRA